MSIAGAVVIFILCWWAVFFTVLPWNIRSQWEDGGGIAEGTEPGAPVDPQILKKALRTTWIAAIIAAVIIGVVASGIINLRQ